MKSTLLATLLALALSPLAIRAAQPASKNLEGELAETVKSARSQMPAPATTFSIDFPGGTIRDFLSATSKIQNVSISIVSSGEASDLDTPLPALSLRNTNVMVALQVLSRLLMPRGFDLAPMEAGPNSAVAVLSRQEAPRPARPPANQFESFQLTQYLAEQTIDDIVGAIRTAWELDPKHEPDALKLKFHPATSILLVSGPADGLQMTFKIISQLRQSPKTNPKPAQKSPSPPEADKR